MTKTGKTPSEFDVTRVLVTCERYGDLPAELHDGGAVAVAIERGQVIAYGNGDHLLTRAGAEKLRRFRALFARTDDEA